MTQQNTLKAALWLLLSALLFSMMGLLIRNVSAHTNNETIVFVRNLVGSLMFLPLLLKYGVGHFRTRRLKLHLLRTFFGITAMYSFFYALAHIPITDAMIFTYSAPVFIPLIAWLWLREIPSPFSLAAVAIGIVGVYWVVKPSDGLFDGISALGFATSVLAAAAFVSVRKLSSTESPVVIVFYFSIFSALVAAIPMYWAWQSVDNLSLLKLIIIGIVATLSQIAMSRAYSLAPASTIGPIAFSSIVFGGIAAWFLWGETPDSLSLLGTLLIFIACLLTLKR